MKTQVGIDDTLENRVEKLEEKVSCIEKSMRENKDILERIECITLEIRGFMKVKKKNKYWFFH